MTDYIAELNRERFRQPAERARQRDSRIIRRATSRGIADIRATQPTPPAHPRPRFVAPQPDPAPPPVQVVSPQPFPEPALPRLRPSRVLTRTGVGFPNRQPSEPSAPADKRSWKPLALQATLVSMAVVVFVVGLGSSLQTLKTNHEASAQVAALVKKANSSKNGSSGIPITAKPSGADFNLYSVAPDLPRYLMIPKLGVDARVLQVGINANGALGTPANVFDTAWYTGSAEPGQPGATLIDGHVSSWTTHGVFYAIKTLQAGDTIQIERGDGTILRYQVVKTQTYNANNVDMKAALTPITPGVSGLNLITCAGDVIKGTNQFSERVIVFAQQV